MARGRGFAVRGVTGSEGAPGAMAGGDALKESDRVRAHRITIEPHPDADRIELARIGGYVSIVPKGRHQDGDVVVYIPEGMIVPEEILRAIGLWDEAKDKGGLAGSDGRRVKAARFRGVVSQGLVYLPEFPVVEGEEYTEELGIVKYAPPIPTNLDGELIACASIRGYTEIENIKRFPDVIQVGEPVRMVEKTHGSCCVAHIAGGEVYASSKGRAAAGLALADVRDERSGDPVNGYWRSLYALGVPGVLQQMAADLEEDEITIYGETYGVQDLRYGLQKGELDFRVFDVRIGSDFVDAEQLDELCARYGLPTLPIIYKGPYSDEALSAATTGAEQVSGSEAHLREGVVVRPLTERIDPEIGRVILKSISPDYLTRKGGTEFN